jgi:hypothetical protein
MTGITSRIIHSGLLPDSRKASIELQALDELLALRLRDVASASSSRRSGVLLVEVDAPAACSRIASAPMPAVNASSPYSSCGRQIVVFRQQLTLLERRSGPAR